MEKPDGKSGEGCERKQEKGEEQEKIRTGRREAEEEKRNTQQEGTGSEEGKTA